MRPSEALAKHRDEVLAILAKYPVSNPRVFGSVARGEDTEASDLDLVVQIAGVMTLFDMAQLGEDLAEQIGAPVDVHSEKDFSERVLRRLERSFKPL
ncbi:nucleotidyltransferase family protein [Tianweitania populi]|uniref:Nucleotidyltransferase n=1 Tax=Tianweitania populi TaxID=1607949 RepID=A0A8J3DSH6_9HYPH|nr:nucleotidyltransferase domain-containing protein [Tianweitania populi]GHD08392.1 nucleotidyltransferase [Tianweitania populi]